MAVNERTVYGRDLRCLFDADPFFTAVEGIEVVRQHAFHRITTDDILGDDGTGSLVIRGWGFDVRRLLGVPASKLPIYQPVLVEVLLRDERVETADVKLEATTNGNGTADLAIEIDCTTALGPFQLVLPSVQDLTADLLEGQVG